MPDVSKKTHMVGPHLKRDGKEKKKTSKTGKGLLASNIHQSDCFVENSFFPESVCSFKQIFIPKHKRQTCCHMFRRLLKHELKSL